MTVYGTPRRLAVHLTNVAKKSADTPFRQKLLPVAIGLDAQGKATAGIEKKARGARRRSQRQEAET